MKRFTYTAVDPQGQATRGVIDAADWSAALALLAAQGLVDCRQEGREELGVLTPDDAVELAGYLSELAGSGVPLSGPLRALAQDASSPSLRAAIDDLTTRIDSGQPLDAALESLGARLPAHMRRLLVAAARSGRLSQALEQLLERQRQVDDMTSRLRQAVAYPAVLLVLLVAWLLFVTWEILPNFNRMLIDDFEVASTGWLTWLGTIVPWLLLGLLAGLAIVGVSVRVLGGAAALSRLLTLLPITGPCRAYRGLTDFAGMLAEFLDEQIPLDESLALAASGTRDPNVQNACRRAAEHVAAGGSLSGALDRRSIFPKTLVRWTQWGESNAALPDALRSAASMFTDRFDLRLQLVRAFVPAIVFVLIAASAVLVAAGIFQGLFSLIKDLAGSGSTQGFEEEPLYWAFFGALFVLIVGTGLLITAAVVRWRGNAADVTRILLRYFGWSFVAAAILVAALLVAGVWGFIGWVVLALAALRGAWRYRQAQKQSLWAGLSLAADKHAPLAPMAFAFADEQGGAFAIQTRHLAQHLQCGADLSQAIARSSGALPAEAALAVRIGDDSGDLCGAMRASRGRRSSTLLMPPALMWLLFFVPIGLGAILFVKLRIEPAWNAIISDFDSAPPAVTTAVSGLIDSPMVIYAALMLGVALLFTWLQWRGTLTPRFPGLKRMIRWIELAPVLRILALVTRRQQPIPQALETIAMWHPNRWIRYRMRGAVRDLALGITWQESLRRRRLLGEADLAVLAAAERNGNLPWALEQMGDSFSRRAEFRLKAWGEFAMPLVVAAFGLMVALFVVAYFIPLVYLINNLT
jgi:general secretion pathway protein F